MDLTSSVLLLLDCAILSRTAVSLADLLWHRAPISENVNKNTYNRSSKLALYKLVRPPIWAEYFVSMALHTMDFCGILTFKSETTFYQLHVGYILY